MRSTIGGPGSSRCQRQLRSTIEAPSTATDARMGSGAAATRMSTVAARSTDRRTRYSATTLATRPTAGRIMRRTATSIEPTTGSGRRFDPHHPDATIRIREQRNDPQRSAGCWLVDFKEPEAIRRAVDGLVMQDDL